MATRKNTTGNGTPTETKHERAARISAEAKAQREAEALAKAEAEAAPFEGTPDTFMPLVDIANNPDMLPTVDEHNSKLAGRTIKAIDRLLAHLETLGHVHPLMKGGRKAPAQGNRDQSACEKPVDVVWALCRQMMIEGEMGEDGQRKFAQRKDVVAACTERGVNIHTAKTQIQLCLKHRGVRPTKSSAE